MGQSEHCRHSIRLAGFDYTLPGAYFVTVVSHQRECLFGEIRDAEMTLNDFGQAVQEEWHKTSLLRPDVGLRAFVVMPNHFHAIVHLLDDDGRGTARHAPTVDRFGSPIPISIPINTPTAERFGSPVPNSIPTILRAFKSAATKRINELRGTPGTPVWQRNYHEHVIRTDHEYAQIEAYILENPLR